MRAPSLLTPFLAFSLIAVTACGGGDGGTTPPPPPVVSSVAVTLAAGTIAVGQTTNATAVARSAQGAVISGKTASWASATPGVATVDANGLVTGVAAGTAQVNATIDGVTGGATITVTPPPVASVTVTLSARSLAAGQTTQATALLKDGAGNTLTGRSLAWTSSNTAVATVSTTGLVTAIAEGKSSITATSEGRSGQDSVTVTPAIGLSELTLLTSSGQPLDASNVSGAIQVRSDPTLPPGFRGTIEVRIGTATLAKDSVFGGTTSGRMATTIRDQLVNTTAVVTTYSADEIRSIPLVGNGSTTVTQVLEGLPASGSPISISRQTPITVRNVDAVRLHVAPERLTLIDGRPWRSGSTSILVEDLAFSGAAIDRIEIIKTPHQAVYGAGAVAGVVNVLTRTGNDVRKKATFTLTGESPGVGDRYAIGLITRGNTTWRLGDIPSLNGNVAALDGSLIATRASVAPTYTLPQGQRYQFIPDVAPGVLPAEFTRVDERATWYDNQAPVAGPNAFTPTSRALTVGARAFGSNGRLGLTGNMLGNTTDLSTFLDFSAFSDAGAGFDVSTTLSYYRSGSRATLFDAASAFTSIGDFPLSNTPTQYLGVSFADKVGNRGFYAATTNGAHPLGTNGDALFGRLASGGSMTATGFTSGMVWGSINWGSVTPQLQLRVAGSLYPPNAFYGMAYTYGTSKTCLEGFGTACDEPVVLGGTVSQGGAQSDYALSLGALRSKRASLTGGSGDGPIEGRYWAADLGGNWSMGGYTKMTPFRAFIDRVQPTASLTATFPSPGNVSVTARFQDAVGSAQGLIGITGNYPSSVFSTGRFYGWIDEFDVGGNDLTSGLSQDASVTFTAPIISTVRFFSPGTGQITNNAFLTDGAAVRGRDFGWNTGQGFLPYTNTAALEPAPANLLQTFYTMSSTQVCNGTGCAASIPTSVRYTIDAITSTSAVPFAKATALIIPTNGLVDFVGKDLTPVTTLVGSTYRHRYEIDFSPAERCIIAGTFLAKVLLLSATGTQLFIPDLFRNLNVIQGTAGTNACRMPPRPLIW